MIIISLYIIALIESSNNPLAINEVSKAYGKYQITQPCLDDFNEAKNTSYSLQEMLSPQTSSEVANWYLNARIPQMLKKLGLLDSVSNRLIAYNAGIGTLKNHKPLPKETRDYIKKYNKLRGEYEKKRQSIP